MDEPTIPEMLRDLQADVTRILAAMDRFVTQEQRAADQAIAELKLGKLTEAVAEQRARTERLKNWVWTAVVAPVIVGLILYLLIGKTP